MIWETSRWCIECALLCVYTFCQTKIQILSLIGLNHYWKFPLFLTLKLPTTIFETIWYTWIWKIQTLRKGKVIFKCICIECLLETLSHYLNSCNLSLPHCPWLSMKIPFKLKCGHFIVSKLCKTLLFWGCVTLPALRTILMQPFIFFSMNFMKEKENIGNDLPSCAWRCNHDLLSSADLQKQYFPEIFALIFHYKKTIFGLFCDNGDSSLCH